MTHISTPRDTAPPAHPAQHPLPAPASTSAAVPSEGRRTAENLWATLTFAWSGPVFVTGPYREVVSAEQAASHIMCPPGGPSDTEGLTWPVKLIAPGADLACTLHDTTDSALPPWPPAPGTHLALNRVRARAIKRTPQPPERPGCAAAVLAMTPDLVYAVLIGPFADMKATRFWTWRRDARSEALDLPRHFSEKVLPLEPLADSGATSVHPPGTTPWPARRSA